MTTSVPDAGSYAGEDLLVVTGLRAQFSTPQGLARAVDGVDLHVARATTVGLVGESGSGKSLLTRSAFGLAPRSAVVSADRIDFDGRDIRGPLAKHQRSMLGREVGIVLQDPFVSLNPVVRVGRHFTETLRRHLDLSSDEARRRGIDLLRRTGIPSPETRFDGYPHELSGGMRQRVCVALAIACEPQLLIADEPTTALDVTTQRQILDLLDDLREDGGMSMILITHDLAIVAGRTERLVVMYAGQVVEIGPTAEIFAAPRHRYTDALLRDVPRIDAERGERLGTIPGRPPSITEIPSGCRFAPRCEHAQRPCREATPGLTAADPSGRQHRCFFPASGDGTPAPVLEEEAS